MHHRAKFRQNRSNRGWDITIFQFFQDGGRPLSWFCNVCVGPPRRAFGPNRCSSFDNMHVFRFREFGLKTPIHDPKLGVFRWKITEGVGRYWPPTNSFLLLWVYMSVSNLVKIDEEMRPWECPQTDTRARTDAKQFYYLSHAICYSYGADNKIARTVTCQVRRWETLSSRQYCSVCVSPHTLQPV